MKTLFLNLLFFAAVFLVFLPKGRANDSLWTVSKAGELFCQGRYGYNYEDYTKKLEKGQKVIPIASYTRLYYKVKTLHGDIGFLHYENIAEAQTLTSKDTVTFYEGRQWAQGEELKLPPGTQAQFIEYISTEGLFVITLEDGKTGVVLNNEMMPQTYYQVPRIDQTARRIFHYDVLIEKVMHQPVDSLTSIFYPPTGVMYQNAADSSGFAFYKYITIVKDRKRSKAFWLYFEHGKIVADSVPPGEKYYVEWLPLSQLMRKHVSVNELFSEKLYEEPYQEATWWEKFKSKNWFTKILGFIVWGLKILLLFWIPQLVAMPLMHLVATRRKFSNGTVSLITSLIHFALYYFYLLVLALLVMYESVWLAIVGVLVVGTWTWRNNQSRITYNRCPNCHAMWAASDKGSTLVNQWFSTARVSRDVYKGTRTEGFMQPKKVRYYERQHGTKTTENRDYTDHRQCTECGYNWDVQRSESKTTTRY